MATRLATPTRAPGEVLPGAPARVESSIKKHARAGVTQMGVWPPL